MKYEKEIEILQHNLKYMREFLEMSEQQIGDMVGVTRQTINNFERGKTKIASVHYLAFINVIHNEILPNCNDNDRNIVLKMLDKKVDKIIKIVSFREES